MPEKQPRHVPTHLEGARIARKLLKRSSKRWRALAEASAPVDADALHDARVSLRRLRVWLRLLAPADAHGDLDEFRKAARRLARASGPLRTAHVHHEKVEDLAASAGLDPADREAASTLLDLIQQPQAAAAPSDELALRRTTRRFLKAVPRLDKALRTLERGTSHSAIEAAWRSHIARDLDRIIQEVEQVGHALDAAPAHRARIRVKRVRYALEPRVDGNPALEGLAAVLEQLQALLGQLHDLQDLCSKASSLTVAAAPGWTAVALDAILSGEGVDSATPASYVNAFRGVSLLRQRSQDALDELHEAWPPLRDALQDAYRQWAQAAPDAAAVAPPA